MLVSYWNRESYIYIGLLTARNLKSSGSQNKSCHPKWRSEQVIIIDWRTFHFWYNENRFDLTRYSISDRHFFEVRIFHISFILFRITSIKLIIFKYPSIFKYLLFWNPIRETYLQRWSLIQIVKWQVHHWLNHHSYCRNVTDDHIHQLSQRMQFFMMQLFSSFIFDNIWINLTTTKQIHTEYIRKINNEDMCNVDSKIKLIFSISSIWNWIWIQWVRHFFKDYMIPLSQRQNNISLSHTIFICSSAFLNIIQSSNSKLSCKIFLMYLWWWRTWSECAFGRELYELWKISVFIIS